jgi:hypothetical protein
VNGNNPPHFVRRLKIIVMRPVIVLCVGVLLLAGCSSGGGRPATSTDPASAHGVPVLFVHGLVVADGCPHSHPAAEAAPLESVLTATHWAGRVVPIDYYCDDSGGTSIRNAAGPSTARYPTAGYTANTGIERLALDLTWFIYKTYSSRGRTVDVVAHSMGGLIVAWGLFRVAAHDPAFPPYVRVHDAVTISTPYDGPDVVPAGKTAASYIATWCGSYRECTEIVPGSPLLTELHAHGLDPQGRGGTDWTTIGGSPNDIVSARSASDLGAVHKISYYAATPGYTHSAYLSDTSAARDAPVRVTDPAGKTSTTVGYHSLAAVALALRSPDY